MIANFDEPAEIETQGSPDRLDGVFYHLDQILLFFFFDFKKFVNLKTLLFKFYLYYFILINNLVFRYECLKY